MLPESPLSHEVYRTADQEYGRKFSINGSPAQSGGDVLSVNDLHEISLQVVEVARDCLVIREE